MDNLSQIYTPGFFETIREGSYTSASEIVPLLLNLYKPESVVDVGCGVGAWLAVFREKGIEKIYGLDGDYVDRSKLYIPEKCFKSADLSKPLELADKFDLCVSVEVAEHLPASVADAFVEGLCKLAPVVLFSAAAPGQGGDHHINEQWPEYWRLLFSKYGYRMFDPFRPLILHNKQIEFWYKQNLFLFAANGFVESSHIFENIYEVTDNTDIMLIAPQIINELTKVTLTKTLKLLPGLFLHTLKYRLHLR